MAVRIAMWSGPRNISTALMRSWGNRPDTAVVDEPFYAHYLVETGLDHPGRDEVIASQPTDWRTVVESLLGEIPGGKKIFYQKQMAHHLLPGIGRDWIHEMVNVFLLRDPREMLLSLIRKTPRIGISDTGLPQQWEIFEMIRRERGAAPPVVDARDVLENPAAMLRALCTTIGVPFSSAMLSWPAGRRASDGVWAKSWYAAVEASTGFEPWRPKNDPLPEQYRDLYEECLSFFERMHRQRIRP